MYRRSDLDADLLRLIDVLSGETSRWPEDPDVADRLTELARAHRVDGLVDELARTNQIALDRATAVAFAGISLRAKHRQSVKDTILVALLEELESFDHQIEVMVLKGWWTSQRCYAQRSDRRYTDLDIWISPHCGTSAGTVAQVLQGSSTPSAQDYDVMLDRGLMHNAGISFRGTLVEIHKNPYGLKSDPRSLASVWTDHAHAATVAGRDVFVASPELSLLIGCVNYTRDCFPQLYQLIDVHRLAQQPDLSWDDFWKLAEQQGLAHFARGALSLRTCLFRVPPVAGLIEPSRWRSWWTRTDHVLALVAPPAARLPAQVLAPAGVRSVAKLGFGWLAPPPAYWEVRTARNRNPVGASAPRNAIDAVRRGSGRVLSRSPR